MNFKFKKVFFNVRALIFLILSSAFIPLSLLSVYLLTIYISAGRPVFSNETNQTLKKAFTINKIISEKIIPDLLKSRQRISWFSLSDTDCPVFSVNKTIYIYDKSSSSLINTFVKGDYPFFSNKENTLLFLKNNHIFMKRFFLNKTNPLLKSKKISDLKFKYLELSPDKNHETAQAAGITIDNEFLLIKTNFKKMSLAITKTGLINCTFPLISPRPEWPVIYLDPQKKLKILKTFNKPFAGDEFKKFFSRSEFITSCYKKNQIAAPLSVSSDGGAAVVMVCPDSSDNHDVYKTTDTNNNGVVSSKHQNQFFIVNPFINSADHISILVNLKKDSYLDNIQYARWESVDPVLWVLAENDFFSITYNGSNSFRNTSIKNMVNNYKAPKNINYNNGTDLIQWHKNNAGINPVSQNTDVYKDRLYTAGIRSFKKKTVIYILWGVPVFKSWLKPFVLHFLKELSFPELYNMIKNKKLPKKRG